MPHVRDRLLKFSLMFALTSALFTSCKKGGYEAPSYRVLKSGGVFEIRDYPESALITTPMQERSKNGSFMRLFRFISGRNDRSEKIPMTVPVLMSGPESGTMSFVIPKKVVLEGAPKPSDPSVSITVMPASRYAAYRFSGRAGLLQYKAASKKLTEWVAAEHLVVAGPPLFASYNPPWTPGFMRRNEVLTRLIQSPPANPQPSPTTR